MAVVDLTHKFQERTASVSWTGQRKENETYFCVSDRSESSALQIILEAQGFSGDVQLPLLGTVHPFDNFAICTSLEASPADADPFTWNIVVKYETQKGDSEPPAAADPVQQKPRFQWGHITERRIVEVDFSSPPRLLLNSARQKFDPPYEVDFSLPTLFFERNEARDRVSQSFSFKNSVNASSWQALGFIAAAGQVKVVSIRSVYTLGRSGDGGTEDHYWVNSFEFVYRVEGWDAELLDIGTQERIDRGEGQMPRFEIRNNTDEEGEQIRAPQLLDGNGRRLAEGANPVFLPPFKVHKRKNFGDLGIPTERP